MRTNALWKVPGLVFWADLGIGLSGNFMESGPGGALCEAVFPESSRNGLLFDGNTDYVHCGRHKIVADVFFGGGTVGCCFKQLYGAIPNHGRLARKNTGWQFYLTQIGGGEGNIYFIQDFSGNEGHWSLTTGEYFYNRWNNITITYNSDSLANHPVFYVNGKMRTIGDGVTRYGNPTGVAIADNDRNLMLGSLHNSVNAINGYMKGIYIFNRKLEPPEVKTIVDVLGRKCG